MFKKHLLDFFIITRAEYIRKTIPSNPEPNKYTNPFTFGVFWNVLCTKKMLIVEIIKAIVKNIIWKYVESKLLLTEGNILKPAFE